LLYYPETKQPQIFAASIISPFWANEATTLQINVSQRNIEFSSELKQVLVVTPATNTDKLSTQTLSFSETIDLRDNPICETAKQHLHAAKKANSASLALLETYSALKLKLKLYFLSEFCPIQL